MIDDKGRRPVSKKFLTFQAVAAFTLIATALAVVVSGISAAIWIVGKAAGIPISFRGAYVAAGIVAIIGFAGYFLRTLVKKR